jgi:PAS domain S-box-containing protein
MTDTSDKGVAEPTRFFYALLAIQLTASLLGGLLAVFVGGVGLLDGPFLGGLLAVNLLIAPMSLMLARQIGAPGAARPESYEEVNEQLRREIADRQEAEEALRKSEQRYRALAEQAVEGIWIADLDTQEIVDVNPAFCKYVGYERDEILGSPIGQFIDRTPEELGFFGEQLRQKGALPPTEGRWINRSGEIIHVRITANLIQQDDRDLVCTIGRDISEEKRLHEQLALTDRLASPGTLAAGIAHEINNPLSYVNTNLHFLEEEITELEADAVEDRQRVDEWLDVLEQSKRGINRMQRIVNDLRSFYRADSHEVTLVDVEEIFDPIVGLVTAEIPAGAELIEEYGDVPHVRANPGALSQVFLNVLVNAIQSLPDERNGRSDRITIRTRETDRGGVAIAIADTGVGIPEEDRTRIFDPFFTTKPVDVGTGLGLSMSHSIVQSFGGEITFETEVGEGTTFYIVLPAPGESELSAESIDFMGG